MTKQSYWYLLTSHVFITSTGLNKVIIQHIFNNSGMFIELTGCALCAYKFHNSCYIIHYFRRYFAYISNHLCTKGLCKGKVLVWTVNCIKENYTYAVEYATQPCDWKCIFRTSVFSSSVVSFTTTWLADKFQSNQKLIQRRQKHSVLSRN